MTYAEWERIYGPRPPRYVPPETRNAYAESGRRLLLGLGLDLLLDGKANSATATTPTGVRGHGG